MAGAIITGGHTIHGAEPIYGLAVAGFVHPDKVLTNSGAKPGDVLILETEMIKQKGPIGIAKAKATVDGKTAVVAELTFAIG